MNHDPPVRRTVGPSMIRRLGASLLHASLVLPCAAQVTETWELAEPRFQVGGVEAEDSSYLANLGGVTVLPNGNVVVGDRVEPFIKIFSADGRFLRSIGSFGEGPGEYEYVYEMGWCAPGELHVEDVDRRIHRYRGDMELVSTEILSLDAVGGGTGYQHACHPNGFRVASGWGDTGAQFKEGLFTATAPVALMRGTELVRNFGERLSSERLGSIRADGSPGGSGPHPFGRATVVAVGSDRVFIGDGSDYSIEVYDLEGSPLPELRWEGPSLEYDGALVERLAEAALASADPSSRPSLRRWYADMPRLEQLPAYDRLLVSDDDHLWVRLFVPPGAGGETWVVFNDQPGPVGRLELPPGSRLWEVRGDEVVYSVLDEFDVPVVRISRIVGDSGG